MIITLKWRLKKKNPQKTTDESSKIPQTQFRLRTFTSISQLTDNLMTRAQRKLVGTITYLLMNPTISFFFFSFTLRINKRTRTIFLSSVLFCSYLFIASAFFWKPKEMAMKKIKIKRFLLQKRNLYSLHATIQPLI